MSCTVIRHHKTGAICDDLSGKNFCKHLLLGKESWNNKDISVFDASFSSPKFEMETGMVSQFLSACLLLFRVIWRGSTEY